MLLCERGVILLYIKLFNSTKIFATELVTGEPPDTVDMVSDRRVRGIAAKVLRLPVPLYSGRYVPSPWQASSLEHYFGQSVYLKYFYIIIFELFFLASASSTLHSLWHKFAKFFCTAAFRRMSPLENYLFTLYFTHFCENDIIIHQLNKLEESRITTSETIAVKEQLGPQKVETKC